MYSNESFDFLRDLVEVNCPSGNVEKRHETSDNVKQEEGNAKKIKMYSFKSDLDRSPRSPERDFKKEEA